MLLLLAQVQQNGIDLFAELGNLTKNVSSPAVVISSVQ